MNEEEITDQVNVAKKLLFDFGTNMNGNIFAIAMMSCACQIIAQTAETKEELKFLKNKLLQSIDVYYEELNSCGS